ncbi:Eukaryotic translation initiation factor 3 subunit A [Cymbomonas tetramitiformis]|uniref:Eukaryotic translation initiation factor 3 subunit A n=1 Tax=Cymbomonas tetramitiformis TaxID=36881 RepID=A0AAE0C2I5_9CHLO|nr:Eukaryotic translation initiation factor 3 subunit A [Cymbomonas tetramitiformis]
MSRYPITFQKPENALKRAEELINVSQKSAALQALHDVLTSKRHRTWQKTLEKIMFKYVELCVDMKKGRFAKEGLIQYRIICQQVNVSSLEEVIKHFLKLASDRAETAQQEADNVSLDVEDLEAEKSPEELMLSYVSGEKDKDRADRSTVTPWFKFLWETYRTVLEILRNNSKLEALYAMTAHRAFQFCLQYKRTTEFRRMCEILRNHLANLNKYRDQRDRPDLTQPESLQLYLETRFDQLKVATELELWQEAFRSVEDIHGLMTLVKKSPKPQMMAIYYAKLTKIFWMSENNLYHAYAWYKLYNLSKTYKKDFTSGDLKLMASCVVLSTLSVPPYDRKHGAAHFELELEKDRNLRMANLLGFSLDPKRDTREVLSRAALLSELNSKNMVALAYPEVKELYNLLENEFHPLDLCQKVQPLLEKLNTMSDGFSSSNTPMPDVSLSQYTPALERLTILRLLQQVSQVYQSVKMPHITKLIPFLSMDEVEKLIVDAVKYNCLQVRIDHQNQCVHFGSQVLESDKIKNHITVLTKRLNRAVQLIHAELGAKQDLASKADSKQTLEQIALEHKTVLARKVIIERRKEEQERLLLEQEREEEETKRKQQRLNEEAEKKRQTEEARKREEDRIRREIEEKENEDLRAMVEQVNKRKGKKGKVEDVSKIDRRQLMEDAISEQIKERQEMERKLLRLGKTMDHLERARREEEVPLIEQLYQTQLVEDEKYFKEQQQMMLEQSKAQYELDFAQKARFVKMQGDKNIFQEQVMSRRTEEFERLNQERLERIEERKAFRKVEREQARKKEYLRRLREEEEARLAAEEEARLEAEREARRLEREEEERVANEAMERQLGLSSPAVRTAMGPTASVIAVVVNVMVVMIAVVVVIAGEVVVTAGPAKSSPVEVMNQRAVVTAGEAADAVMMDLLAVVIAGAVAASVTMDLLVVVVTAGVDLLVVVVTAVMMVLAVTTDLPEVVTAGVVVTVMPLAAMPLVVMIEGNLEVPGGKSCIKAAELLKG